jgi:uncharacterized protein YndB with AHSA1/START domain
MVVSVSAPRERVFAFLRDPMKVKRWQPDVVTTTIVSGDGLQKGSRWRATVKEPQRGTFDLEVWVADVVANERIAYAMEEPQSHAEIEYRLISSGNGTQVVCSADFKLKGIARFLSPLVKGFVARKFRSRLSLLREQIEADEERRSAAQQAVHRTGERYDQ